MENIILFDAVDPISLPANVNFFYCMGEYWVFRFNGKTAVKNALKGFSIIQYLIIYKNKKFTTIDLKEELEMVEVPKNATKNYHLILDSKAKSDYKMALYRLNEEYNEAFKKNQTELAKQLNCFS